MLLYHYSNEEYKELGSLNYQKKAKKENGVDKIENYSDHISFFLEPIPIDLPDILEGKHNFWKSGQTLYEHIVDTNVFHPDIKYVIVETPEKTHLLYSIQDWSKCEGNPELIKKYKSQIRKMEIRKGYSGEGITSFVKAAKPLSHGIKGYYRNMVKLDKENPEDNLMDKYASCVPHVMMYTGMDPIKVKRVKQITLK